MQHPSSNIFSSNNNSSEKTQKTNATVSKTLSKKTAVQSNNHSRQAPPRKTSWFTRMFCCAPQAIPAPLPQPVRTRRHTTKIKKIGHIQLALLGSVYQFKLCKISRKNLALDGYKDIGIMPNQVSRYISEKVIGTFALVHGRVSCILTRNIVHPLHVSTEASSILQDVFQVPAVSQLKLRVREYFIYRFNTGDNNNPSSRKAISRMSSERGDVTTTKECRMFVLDEETCCQLKKIIRMFERSVLIFPAEVVLDELGILLHSIGSLEAEVESIVVNGKVILYIVYVGNTDFVKVRQEQILSFVAKQLRKDSVISDMNVQAFLTFLSKTLGINQILELLVKSIGEAVFDTVMTAFLRNLVLYSQIPQEDIRSALKIKELPVFGCTPNISLTASFGILKSQRDEGEEGLLLNQAGGELKHENEIDVEIEEQLTMSGMCLVEDTKHK